MKIHFELALAKLNRLLEENAARTEDAVNAAVRAMERGESDLAQRVIDDDEAIDRAENQIEEECLEILALYQPVATDLRRVMTIFKANGEIERAGDLAVNIANRVADATAYGIADRWNFATISDRATRMFSDALLSLHKGDAMLARRVIEADEEVDALHRASYSKVAEGIVSEPASAGYYLDALTVSRALERLADIATNIAEDVIYLETAEIVRHR
ncbi:MAG: phosphate signaling complex protein PhoU [Kiritimatiellia bacterium]